MVGDDKWHVKPRMGEYILLHKNQGHQVLCCAVLCSAMHICTPGAHARAHARAHVTHML